LSALLLGLVLALDAGALDSAPTVSAQVDRKEARVGDVIVLTVLAVAPRDVPVNLPHTLELGPFSELDEQNRKTETKDLGDGKVRREFTAQIAAYETGDLSVPSVEVTYLGKGGEVLTTRTEPIPIKVTSLLANEAEPALKENAPPVRVLQRDLLLVYIAGGLLAAGLGALVATMVRRKLRARASLRPAPPPRPAHEIALDRLDRLGARGLPEGGDHRPFYFELSEIVREYLGGRWGFDSLELTTAELMEELRNRASRELTLGEVEGWLSGCDLVKFAKVSPTTQEARGALEWAIRLVESTRPRFQPQVTAPAQEAAHA
jgi:hypothetical protein